MTLAREAKPGPALIEEYCKQYRTIFSDVRNYEAFRDIHTGMLSNEKRKSLPAIARIVGLKNHQGLHHFLGKSKWKVEEVRKKRLDMLKEAIKRRKIRLIVDETGDPKKGTKTDYVARQYIGRLGKIENGIVAVVIYGVLEGITFPILFEVYKPKTRLKEGDVYRTKPEIASQLVEEIVKHGFNIDCILSDSLYGESSSKFLRKLEELKLEYMVAIRSNHGVWMPEGAEVIAEEWKPFERKFSDGKTEKRYVQEIIFGQRRRWTYWYITTDPETLPENATSFVKSNIQSLQYSDVGNIYGDRTWVEYGFRQSKSELGWADFRVTQYSQIERWWEIVCSTYTIITLMSLSLFEDSEHKTHPFQKDVIQSFHREFGEESSSGWKSTLNKVRVLLLPFICFNLLDFWLRLFPNPELSSGFSELIALVNHATFSIFSPPSSGQFSFSSA